MLLVLALLRWCLDLFGCHISHVSVIVVSAMVYHIGGIGWLGVKSQHFINVLGTYTLSCLRRTLEHVPQVFLLLDLLSLHGLVVRYWRV